MKPYYQDDHVTLYVGDCRGVLPALDLGEVRATITDPPYAETSLAWDRWPRGWVTAVGAATPTRAPLWCFGSLRMFLDRAPEFDGWKLAQDIVMEKHNGSSPTVDRFRRTHELVVQWYRGRWDDTYRSPVYTNDAQARRVHRRRRPPQWGEIGAAIYESTDGGPRLMTSVIPVRSEHGQAIHPTQKPRSILQPLIEFSCPAGGVVLDPFAGSGSTLRTAKDCGRRAIGIEADESMAEAAAAWLAQEVLPLEVPTP